MQCCNSLGSAMTESSATLGKKLINYINLNLQLKKKPKPSSFCAWKGFTQRLKTVSTPWGCSLPCSDNFGALPDERSWELYPLVALSCDTAFHLSTSPALADVWYQGCEGDLPWQQRQVDAPEHWALQVCLRNCLPLSLIAGWEVLFGCLSVNFCASCILITQMIK